MFLTGLAYISLPSGGGEAYIVGGYSNSMIVAADTTGPGHYTTFPTGETTHALQIPLAGGLSGLPDYRVLNADGPCESDDQVVSLN